MTPFVTMRRALSDTHLLGAALGGDSWLAWRILLIAAMGEPLTDEERAIFAKLTGREREPGERVDELWCVIGRRGGKSRAIAALLVYLATMVDYRSQLVLGERGVVLCLARTQEQSQVVLEYVAGIIEAAPMLAKMVVRRAANRAFAGDNAAGGGVTGAGCAVCRPGRPIWIGAGRRMMDDETVTPVVNDVVKPSLESVGRARRHDRAVKIEQGRRYGGWEGVGQVAFVVRRLGRSATDWPER